MAKGKMNWEKVRRENQARLYTPPENKEPPMGYCARCKKPHPVETLIKHRNGYLLCSNDGYGYRDQTEVQRSIAAAEALARIKRVAPNR